MDHVNHYFSGNPGGPSDEQTLEVTLKQRPFRFITDNNVFSKARIDYGTRLLIESISFPDTGRLLDIGCGYGPIGIVAGGLHPDLHVWLVDVNERATALARRNAQLNGLKESQVTVVTGDGVPAVDFAFDAVVTNPPYRAGNRVVHRLLKDGWAVLAPGGALTVVGQTKQGIKSLTKWMRETLGHAEELNKGGGYRVIASVKPKDA